MRIDHYQEPVSGFLSAEKDLNLIVEKILKNDRIKKMLYYTSKDALKKPPLTEDQTAELFGNQIRIVPKLEVDTEQKVYLIISFDDFFMNNTNPEFRDCSIEFDIVCNFDLWHLQDFSLRPYKIAAELDAMFNERKLSGIGKLEFMGATKGILNDEFGVFCLMYRAVHGGEDERHALQEAEDKDIIENFDKIFNI